MLAVFESSPSPTPPFSTPSASALSGSLCQHLSPDNQWLLDYMKADCSSMEPGMIPQLTVCITSDGWEARALSLSYTHTHTHTDHGQLQTKTLRNDHAFGHSQTLITFVFD